MTWKTLARHRWVSGATITESMLEEDDRYRRFTATVLGWRGFKIAEGRASPELGRKVKEKVTEIRDRIEAGDESVFHELGGFER